MSLLTPILTKLKRLANSSVDILDDAGADRDAEDCRRAGKPRHASFAVDSLRFNFQEGS